MKEVSRTLAAYPNHPVVRASSGYKVASIHNLEHFASHLSNGYPGGRLGAVIPTHSFQFHFSLIMYLMFCAIKVILQNTLWFRSLNKSIKCNTNETNGNRLILTRDKRRSQYAGQWSDTSTPPSLYLCEVMR